MPLYRYRCDSCSHETAVEMSINDHEIWRGVYPFHFAGTVHADELRWGERETEAEFHVGKACGRYRQILGVNFKRPMAEHYNASVGTHISSEHQATEHLKRQSEEMSSRMGFETRYELVDPKETPGVTEQGLYETERRHRALGWTEPTKKIIT